MERRMINLVQAVKYSSPVVGIYERLLNKKCRSVEAYVFVATTGRSGSKSLCTILEAADNAVTFHESYPIMYSDFPEGADKKAYFDRIFYRSKIINVKRDAAGHRYYADTNHQFIKNYFTQSVDYFGNKLRVIHMYRDPMKAALSFYSIGTIPGKTSDGKLYTLDPAHHDNLIQINDLLTGDQAFNHDFFRCLWYWYETEARVKKYKAEFPNVIWSELATEELNDKNALVRMFNQLGVSFSMEKLDQLVGARENTQQIRGKKAAVLADAEEMSALLLDKMEERYGKQFWC
jgi:hypothetical protein